MNYFYYIKVSSCSKTRLTIQGQFQAFFIYIVAECKDSKRTSATIQDLAKTFTTLNSKWTDVTGCVDKNCTMLKDASFLYGEFRSLNAQEMDWLDRLERKLKKPVTAAADMEELSEDLDVRNGTDIFFLSDFCLPIWNV